MQPEERDAAYLWDMLQEARKAFITLKDKSIQDFLADEDLRLVIERRLEIIGEAARRLSDNYRSNHPEVPWHRWIAQRNVMAHQYDEIDHERVWLVVKDNIPGLIETLEQLVPSPPSE